MTILRRKLWFELENGKHVMKQQNIRTLMGTSAFPLIALILIMAVFTALSYQGLMSPDSQTIYSAAINHRYSDHHPPLMAYMWHYLDLIHQGPGLMYLINLAMLSATMVIGLKLFKNTSYKYWFVIFPLIPQIAVYTVWIWKDIIFTFGYGLLALTLARYHINHKRLGYVGIILFFIGLFYFTSVKYQAQFILPVMLLGFFTVQCKAIPFWQKALKTLIATGLMISSIHFVNSWLVNEKGSGSNHAWQYVKIYDLAGMSIHTNQVLVPEFLLKSSRVTVNDIEKKYDLAWEPLVVYKDSPLRATDSDEERKTLLSTWRQAVLDHPVAYLKHRGYIWVRGLLLSAPGKSFVVENFSHISWVAWAVKYIHPLATLSAYIFLVPFIIFCFILGFRNLHHAQNRPIAQILLWLNTMGIMLVFLLLFFSLAAVPRYIYFSVYMFMLSVPFAALLFQKKDKAMTVLQGNSH